MNSGNIYSWRLYFLCGIENINRCPEARNEINMCHLQTLVLSLPPIHLIPFSEQVWWGQLEAHAWIHVPCPHTVGIGHKDGRLISIFGVWQLRVGMEMRRQWQWRLDTSTTVLKLTMRRSVSGTLKYLGLMFQT